MIQIEPSFELFRPQRLLFIEASDQLPTQEAQSSPETNPENILGELEQREVSLSAKEDELLKRLADTVIQDEKAVSPAVFERALNVPGFVEAVLSNRGVTSEVIARIPLEFRRSISETSGDSELLYHLLNDPNVVIQSIVLEKLMRSSGYVAFDKAISEVDRDRAVGDIIYDHRDDPNVPMILIKYPDRNTRWGVLRAHEDNPNVYMQFANDPDRNIRADVVSKIHDPNVLMIFVNDPDEYVRSKVVEQTSDTKVLAAFANDSKSGVREAVAEKTDDIGILKKLSADEHIYVRNIAMSRLKQIEK
jgi:hypothetical protein